MIHLQLPAREATVQGAIPSSKASSKGSAHNLPNLKLSSGHTLEVGGRERILQYCNFFFRCVRDKLNGIPLVQCQGSTPRKYGTVGKGPATGPTVTQTSLDPKKVNVCSDRNSLGLNPQGAPIKRGSLRLGFSISSGKSSTPPVSQQE